MNLKKTKQEYKNAINDIFCKATELSNIKDFNENSKKLNIQYQKLLDQFKNDSYLFETNYEGIKENHLRVLKSNLQKFKLNKELEILKDGNIYDNIDIIEKYIKENKYLDEISLIVAINIYSSFKSVRNNIKKSTYPNLFNLISKEKYSLQFKSFCPFCKKDISLNSFKKSKPYISDLEINRISKCDCNYPSREDKSLEYIQKMNLIINPNADYLEISFENNYQEELKKYTKEKYPNFFNMNNNQLSIYEDETEFQVCSIDSQVWAKIKKNDFNFNYYEISKIEKIPNALLDGIKIYSLDYVIENLGTIIKEKLIEVNAEGYKIHEAFVYCKSNYFEELFCVNPQLISYIQNYQKKEIKSVEKELDQAEVLALGYYCKSQNITMNDIDKYKSLSDFCDMHNIYFDEIKELISNNLY